MTLPVRSWVALLRSLVVYHGDRARHRRMDKLYSRYVRPGDLVFDIGAHVGDRIASFRRLGARVVALEPQPAPAAILWLLFKRDREVTLLREAVAEREGERPLHVNTRNPTVSTLSEAFVAAAQGAQNWVGQKWDKVITVRTTTLDALIEAHGRPTFVKIDVEGYEHVVLSSLSMPIPALSFEFTTIARDEAIACLDRLQAIGDYRYNVALGETQELVFPRSVPAAEMRTYLLDVPDAANSGDVYARLSSD
jgi:FkbM family methyltransferase